MYNKNIKKIIYLATLIIISITINVITPRVIYEVSHENNKDY